MTLQGAYHILVAQRLGDVETVVYDGVTDQGPEKPAAKCERSPKGLNSEGPASLLQKNTRSGRPRPQRMRWGWLIDHEDEEAG